MSTSASVTLVTPAGAPLGRAFALALARAGCHVAAHDLNPLHLEETVARVRALGQQAAAFSSDIVKKMPVQTLINQVTDAFGRLDVLVHGVHAPFRAPLLDMDEWDWHRTLDVNLTTAFLLTQVAGRVMRAQGGGLILLRCDPLEAPQPGDGACRSARAGVRALMQSAAQELAPHGVRVAGFAPSRAPEAWPLAEAVRRWLDPAAAFAGEVTPVRIPGEESHG